MDNIFDATLIVVLIVVLSLIASIISELFFAETFGIAYLITIGLFILLIAIITSGGEQND